MIGLLLTLRYQKMPIQQIKRTTFTIWILSQRSTITETTVLPHVLITLALEEDPDSTLEFEPWKRWLQQTPALIKCAKVQGVYKSNSTFVILSIPVVVWDWIPEDPACVFIGYVHSDNLLGHTAAVLDRSIESAGDKIFVESHKKYEIRPEKRVHPEVGFHNSGQPSSRNNALSDVSTCVEVKKEVEMLGKKIDYPEECFENSWHPEFSSPRIYEDDTALSDSETMIDGDEDILGFFLNSGNTTFPCEVEVIEEFCWGASLGDLVSGIGTAGHRKAAWLNDRGGSPDLTGIGHKRQYDNPMTATGLYRALKKPRFNHEGSPDAERRLIYIADLDPAYILALAKTVSCQQLSVLREAIYKHLVFHASIAVKISTTGYRTFQLDLHLPFFKLRKSKSPEAHTGKINTKPRRHWRDLSFLKLTSSELRDQGPPSEIRGEYTEVWGLYETQISFVITGTNDWRWVGYAFFDTEFDDYLDLPETGMSFDPSLDPTASEPGLNNPIWTPRDYFLKVFEIRMEQVRKEWECIAQKVELTVKRYVRS
jgi:hypothetical protein